jgi:hypothetical protein
VIGSGFLAPRRNSIAHRHQPWRNASEYAIVARAYHLNHEPLDRSSYSVFSHGGVVEPRGRAERGNDSNEKERLEAGAQAVVLAVVTII